MIASFLIKPASGRCNLACRYCFYRDLADSRAVPDYGLMTEETTSVLLDRAFELGAKEYAFSFQGGEPTMAGLDYFRTFARIAARKNVAGAELHYAMQTNGTTLDADWARFLKQENFLVGVSIDGPRLLHDAFRTDKAAGATYDRVMAGVDSLRAAGVPVNALCVVDAATADNAELVYSHLRKRGFDWIQYIPCLDPPGEEPGGRVWSLSPAAFASFLRKTFDLWHADLRRGTPVHVRWFDNLVGMAMGLPPESCAMTGRCGAYFTVEADGSVYPCDFYVVDQWRLGDVRSSSLVDMAGGETARRFAATSEPVDRECVSCFAYPLCRGGCRRDREPFADGKPGLNRYCPAFKDFFAFAGERIMETAKTFLVRGQAAAE